MLSLLISDYKCLNNTLSLNPSKYVNISICSVQNELNNFKYALNISKFAIDAFGSYVNFDYILSKCGIYKSTIHQYKIPFFKCTFYH